MARHRRSTTIIISWLMIVMVKHKEITKIIRRIVIIMMILPWILSAAKIVRKMLILLKSGWTLLHSYHVSLFLLTFLSFTLIFFSFPAVLLRFSQFTNRKLNIFWGCHEAMRKLWRGVLMDVEKVFMTFSGMKIC